MQPLQICIGPTIRIGRESWCLPYAGFFRSNTTTQDIVFAKSDTTRIVCLAKSYTIENMIF